MLPYNDFIYFTPEIYFLFCVITLLVFGIFWHQPTLKSTIDRPVLVKNTLWLFSLVFSIYILLLYNGILLNNIFLFDKALQLNSYSTFAKIFLVIVSNIVLIASLNYVKNEKINQYEFAILIGFATIGAILLLNSFNLLASYLALELQTLSIYALIAIKRSSEKSLEASIKYLILSAFSSGILLFGISLVYGATGTIHFDKINIILSIYFFDFENNSLIYNSYDVGIFLFANILITIGFLFKINAAPFHIWAPDVYEGSPTPVTTYLSTASKIGSLFFLIKLIIIPFFPILFNLDMNNNILLYSSVLSLLIGSFGALYQKKLKRLAAYSTIANIGYILIGFYLITFGYEGTYAATFYILIYLLTSVGFFLIVLSLRKQRGTGLLKYLADIKSLNIINSMLAFSLTVILFSMAGIPPLAGFFAKLHIFLAAIAQEKYWLAIFGVITSSISCFYYLRVIKTMYFEKITQFLFIVAPSRENSLMLGMIIILLIFFFLSPNVLLHFIDTFDLIKN
uniref:NADH dehydrogenase subunit 2 n=1 Tax=Cyanophora biloba TaxID=1489483 RepID=A0A873WY44_9EUKA|nr:NADH dehydrogenase subunit 2 [Cyanophora biloba]QPB15002.1 NADH dehydrogenase subunit 2 [Cyanophora biloba]